MSMSYADIEATLAASGQRFEIETLRLGDHTVRNWKNAPRNVGEILRASAARGADDFIVYRDERLSFAQHYARAASIARYLVEEAGIRKGERVAIAMRNYPEWCCAFWGAAAAGAVVVPLNAWWSARELEYGLNDSGARLVFADRSRLERIATVRPALQALETVIAVRCDEVPADAVDYARLVSAADPALSLPEIALAPEDPATIFYTSGTTGFPKGTLGTHRNFCSAPVSAAYASAQALLRAGGQLEHLPLLDAFKQAALLTIPLFHVSGCHGVMLNMISTGGKVVMMHKWDRAEALDLIAREKITLFVGVPTMVLQLLDEPGLEQRDLSSLLNVGYGGAPAAPEVLRRLKRRIPNAGASNGWGITETSSTICMINGADYQAKPDSVGPPVPVCELRVVDAAGRTLGSNELGELWVRGPNVVSGYWNNPGATAESFSEGWFHTGDVGRIDADGCVYLVDRLKDMIIRAGENIYCAEVEAALLEHASVRSASVFGLPHAVLGEEVAAVVETPPGSSVTAEDLQRHVAERLAHFEVPGRIWIRHEALPVGATGKIQKKELREYYIAHPG